jgi:hypothetical protein
MDEFIILLVIAFIVLGVLMIFGTPLSELAGQTPGIGSNTLAEFTVGQVGFSESDVYRTVSFGSFALGQPQEEVLRSLKRVGVSKGYFGEDFKTYEILANRNVLNGLKDVSITFYIENTNLLGNLIINWNSQTVLDKVANLDRYRIKIEPQFVTTSNNLMISAGPPGIAFWDANSYVLKDLEVVAEYGPEKIFYFEIYPNELEAWNLGTLKFYTTSGNNGELSIRLNGNEIFRKVNPEHLTEVELKFSDIANKMKLGENVLSLKSDKPFEIDDLKLDISLSTSNVVRERDFTVPEQGLPPKGHVIFNVDSIYKPGVLRIKINNHELNVQTIRSGENTVEFDAGYLESGQNTISFSGDGSWDIGDTRIVV